VFEVLEPYNLA